MLFLAACGGSGSNSQANTLSGTAAAGAPILGFVTVKDAEGTLTQPAPIEADGKYTVDVSGLKAPFKLKAEGKVGSTTVVYYSAALSSDLGGTINITPFTDLIFAQVAGEVAANYFARTDSSKLSAGSIATETERVRSALTNVLQAAGVSTSINLLRESFNADGTGLDKVMDIVKVTVDPASGAAEIRNLLNDSATAYNVTAPGTIEPVASPSAASVSDVDQIRLGTKSFFDKFATSIPSFQQLQSLGFVDEARFKQGGLDFNGFYSQILNDSSIIGIKFVSLKIVTLTETTAKAHVVFSLFGETHTFTWKFSKASGTWKTLGDQRIAEISIGAAADRFSGNGAAYEYSTGFNVDISNPGGEAAYALVKGPGLPGGGLRLENQIDSEYFVVVSQGGGDDWYPLEDDVVVAAFANKDVNIPYTFEFYAANGSLLATYTEILAKAPLTKAEVQANSDKYFANLTTPATSAALWTLVSLLQDGNMHAANFAWTVPTGMHTGEISVALQGQSAWNSFRKSAPVSGVSLQLQAQDSTGAPFEVEGAEYRVHMRDVFGREFDTALFVNVP